MTLPFARRRWREQTAAAVACCAGVGGMVMLALATALSAPPSLRAADTTVTIVGFAFDPQTVTVQVGDTVTWMNQDGTPHTVTSDPGTPEAFDLAIADGASASFTFDSPGTYAYHCTIHRGMAGTVVAQGTAATPTPTPLATLAPTATPAGPMPTQSTAAGAGSPPPTVPDSASRQDGSVSPITALGLILVACGIILGAIPRRRRRRPIG